MGFSVKRITTCFVPIVSLIMIILVYTIYKDKMFLLLTLSIIFFVEIMLNILFKLKLHVRLLFYAIILFIFEEHLIMGPPSYAIILKYTLYFEKVFLLFMLFVSVLKNRNNKSNFNVLTLIVSAFIILNYISINTTYGTNINLFVNTTYYYCKYFILIYFIVLSKFNDDDMYLLLKLLSPLVIIGTIISLLQVMGIEQAFELFQGKYDVQVRSGININRTIGYLAHALSFANHSMMLFCLYYFLGKYKYPVKWLKLLSLMLSIDILLTQSRSAIIILLAIFIFDNIKRFKSTLKTLVIIGFTFFVISHFFDIGKLIIFTQKEYKSIDETPRGYYTVKGYEVWKDHLFAGIGFNMFGEMDNRIITNDLIFSTYGIKNFTDNGHQLLSTDTFVAKILPEFGIFGCAIILIFIMYLRLHYKQAVKHDLSSKAYLYSVIACLALANNTANVFFNPGAGSFFWISLGMILSNSLRFRNVLDHESRTPTMKQGLVLMD